MLSASESIRAEISEVALLGGDITKMTAFIAEGAIKEWSPTETAAALVKVSMSLAITLQALPEPQRSGIWAKMAMTMAAGEP